ncbi:hypothetical protein [Salmonella enterica]|uniref:hypothetical protein n=1 Tax=Salmonella enterica TaxID=28901 RepID=UPI000FB7B439|nr:hypothetical protein [Salmonella enterica]EBX5121268.1 hypothetical protein [Salmonella enterica subsp. enterica serovar Braenderup]ECB7021915.1 hypothetical protein [Salmonella enterica subsp. enterica serovar Braenderup]MLV10241.1 hypothetical protein [Salmonella enterica subsp. enterica serovar Braenderup]
MTTITREQQKQILIDTANHVISRDNTSPYSENLRELARIALASLDAEPMFYVDVEAAKRVIKGHTRFATITTEPKKGASLPIYLYPPVPVVPDDWVMVPKEPTRQMMAQGHFAMKGTDRGKFRRIYQVMITAASALNKGEY